MSRPSILILIPNLGPGGAQRVFRDHLAFYSLHARVVGCVFNWDGAFASDRNASNIVSLNIDGGRGWIGKTIQFWRRVRVLKKLKKDLAINITISHLEGADYVNYFARSGDKCIAWIHGTKVFDGHISGILGLIRRRLLMPLVYRRLDRVITVSDAIRQEMIGPIGVPAERVQRIYNGIDYSNILNAANATLPEQEQQLFSGSLVFITHCRLADQKNLKNLISVYHGLHQAGRTRLIILGEGELSNQLVEFSEARGLNTFSHVRGDQLNEAYAVYFLGHRNNPYAYLSKASVYLMTSKWEGFPLSLCEAMVCGPAVFVSDCHTGPREIVAPGFDEPAPVQVPVNTGLGYLMPMCESKEQIDLWIHTIRTSLDHGSPGNSDKARERVRQLNKSVIEGDLLRVIS